MTQAAKAATTPPPPAAVAQAPAAAATTVTPDMLSPRDIAAMRKRKNELSNLLSNVSDRRKEVQSLLRTATTPADKAGLEQRLSYLDGRITRIEAEIDQNSSQLASMEAMRVGTVSDPGLSSGRSSNSRSDAYVPVAVCFVLFVMSPIALTISRGLWRRSSLPKSAPSSDNTERLVRMEQAIDSIAIEVERVSEGQRFVTRLMAEGKQPVPVGQGQPMGEVARR